jgi:DMSO/TMAO reductase YedYZ molybdopterin-dependent catalytic subunit
MSTKSRPALAAAMIALLSVGLPATHAQTPSPATATLIVGGDLSKPATLSASDLKQMPRTTIVVKEGTGEARYEGVLVSEILKNAGAPIGQELNGRAIASYVLAGASDGYQVVLAIAEVDPRLTDSEIIVADTVNGAALGAAQGPLKLIAPHDKHPSRSVRMLQRLDFVRLRK